jgi:hypothetical protein
MPGPDMIVLRNAALAALFVLAGTTATFADENVSVRGEYLTDSDGYNYGVNWYLDSTVSTQVCVMPYVTDATNVNGSVTPGPVLMQPNETGVNIGQYISADQSKPWSSNVAAKWRSGDC